jgi:uncharacterized phage-like protein YoqJ
MTYKVAFTGHRPPKLGGYGHTPTKTWLQNVISDQLRGLCLEKEGLEVMSGCAQGTDQIAAFEAWLLRREGMNIRLTMVMPYPSFGDNWPWQAWKHLEWLLEQADLVHYVNQGFHEVWKLDARNKYLVDYSDLLVAVHDGSGGGTDNCIKYAISRGRPYLRINPRTRQMKTIQPMAKRNSVQLRMNL